MEALGVLFILGGLFFFSTAVIGILRLPDFYCRMQSLGKADTCGVLGVLLGFVLFYLAEGITWERFLVALKLLIIVFLWFIGGPTATHALLRSAFEGGKMPWSKDGRPVVDWPEGKG